MKKLTEQSYKNSASEYDKIFLERQKKGVDWADRRRWKELVKYYDGGLLCDLGCLDSEIPKMIKEENYYGVDSAIEAMWEMRKRYPLARLEVRNIYATPFVDLYFQYVVLGEVLEHLEKPMDAIVEAFRILNNDGVLAISVPLEEEREIGACDKERHVWSFSEDDLFTMVMPFASDVRKKVLRSRYFPFYRYCWPTLIMWAKKK